ncbi:MAG TPA: type II toxin-antitoxin system HicA family toxin [Methanospirillum sp.]|uniref:type II toxin-antitoxin system HicA family toxin n=1 Tax=Methanospirillum sp. TaxID=45200 RepID=UPI002BC4E770|nr:type II toxin-antitoxin system HicA family toxin [Methanospirillum sp.]MDD3092072.1 type II toxin-antitoxin system HicA family toxin [Methanoregulaceae archaeon]HPY61468.1 type II toxin-antitoxin system HicA family toxin [Methanospirillum sp.]
MKLFIISKKQQSYIWRNSLSQKTGDRLSLPLRWCRLPKHRSISGEKVVKILCNTFNFKITGRSGSHVRLSKEENGMKVGTVVPMHKELKTGTLHGILRLAKIDPGEFDRYV